VRLQRLRRRRRLVIQRRDVAVTLRIVIVGVDDDLSRERLDRRGVSMDFDGPAFRPS
jgi:hypothetical protein